MWQVTSGALQRADILVCSPLVGNLRGEVLEVGAELVICLADLTELVLEESSWVAMATMPETVAKRIARMEPSPAVMVWSA